ncbi:hypothetical protein ACWGA9_14705 [Streptomyces sp. NPDC054950]
MSPPPLRRPQPLSAQDCRSNPTRSIPTTSNTYGYSDSAQVWGRYGRDDFEKRG